MMKKTYMNLQTEVVDIKIENHLLAGSVTGENILGGDTGGTGLSREEDELLFGDQSGVFDMLLK